MTETRHTIDCPLEWCAGNWLEHGGDGASPDEWLHTDGLGTYLANDAILYRSQLAAGESYWELTIDGVTCMGAKSPASLSERLRALADAVAVIEP